METFLRIMCAKASIIDPNKKVNKIKQQPKAGKFIEYGYVWLTI